MTDHIEFDQLSEFTDGALADTDRVRVERHLAGCTDCGAQVAALARLADRASALPREQTAPADLWSGIRSALPPRDAGRDAVRQARPGKLLAAAAIIAIVSSGVTALLLRGTRSQLGSAVAASASAPPRADLPAQSASDERNYARSAGALEESLALRRDSLAPSTVATVERSLRVADSAIAEARMALASDPGSRVLARLFASNYERKIDLLRRANELAPRT